MGTGVEALQTWTAHLVQRIFDLFVSVVIGNSQILAAWRNLAAQRIVLQSTALQFVGALLIPE